MACYLQVVAWQIPHKRQNTFRQVFSSSRSDLINSEREKLGSLQQHYTVL